MFHAKARRREGFTRKTEVRWVAVHVETRRRGDAEDVAPGELRRALDTVARSHGASDLSRRSGVTRAGITKALGEDGNLSFETVRSNLAAMGLRLTVGAA